MAGNTDARRKIVDQVKNSSLELHRHYHKPYNNSIINYNLLKFKRIPNCHSILCYIKNQLFFVTSYIFRLYANIIIATRIRLQYYNHYIFNICITQYNIKMLNCMIFLLFITHNSFKIIILNTYQLLQCYSDCQITFFFNFIGFFISFIIIIVIKFFF